MNTSFVMSFINYIHQKTYQVAGILFPAGERLDLPEIPAVPCDAESFLQVNLRGVLPILETVGKACKKHGATEAHTKVLEHREFVQRCHDFPAEALAYWKAENRALAIGAFAPVDAVQLAKFASILPYDSMPVFMYSHLSFDYVIMMGLQNLASIEVSDESCFLRLSGETLIQFISGIEVAPHFLKNKALWLSVLEHPEVADALGRWPSPEKLLALMPMFGLKSIVRIDGTQAWNWETKDAPTFGDTQGVTEMLIEESGTFEDPDGNLHHVFPFLAYQDEVASATPFVSGVLPAIGSVEEIIAEVIGTAYFDQLPVLEDPLTVYHVLSLPKFEPFEDLLNEKQVAQAGVNTQTASVFDGESVCDESNLDIAVCEKVDFGSDISTLLEMMYNAPTVPTTAVDTKNGLVDDETQDSVYDDEPDAMSAGEPCILGDDNQDADSRDDSSSIRSIERAIASFEESSAARDGVPSDTVVVAATGGMNNDLTAAFVDWLGWQQHFEKFDPDLEMPDMYNTDPPKVTLAQSAETTLQITPIYPTKYFPGEADLLTLEGSSSTPNIAAKAPLKTASATLEESSPASEIVANTPLDETCTPQRWSATPILAAAAAAVVLVSVVSPALTSVVCVMGIYCVKRILRP